VPRASARRTTRSAEGGAPRPEAPAARPTVFTVGHSNRSTAELLALLLQARVGLLVDVRAFPHSRANPQFDAEVLGASLRAAGIAYLHLAALGGRRRRDRHSPASPNTLWHHQAFRNYADYALTGAFRDGLQELTALAAGNTTAIMCSEAVWWRCHRRIITDYLLVAGLPVSHILGEKQIRAATLTPGAQPRADGSILYPEPPPGALNGA